MPRGNVEYRHVIWTWIYLDLKVFHVLGSILRTPVKFHLIVMCAKKWLWSNTIHYICFNDTAGIISSSIEIEHDRFVLFVK